MQGVVAPKWPAYQLTGFREQKSCEPVGDNVLQDAAGVSPQEPEPRVMHETFWYHRGIVWSPSEQREEEEDQSVVLQRRHETVNESGSWVFSAAGLHCEP